MPSLQQASDSLSLERNAQQLLRGTTEQTLTDPLPILAQQAAKKRRITDDRVHEASMGGTSSTYIVFPDLRPQQAFR